MNQPFQAGVFAFVHGKQIMQIEPELLTDHTEFICSTNIERIVTGRDAALKQIGTLIENLNDISELTSRIGGGIAEDCAMQQGHGHGHDRRLTKPVSESMAAITRSRTLSVPKPLSANHHKPKLFFCA